MAPSAWARSEAADAEARAIHDTVDAIRDAEGRARSLRGRLDTLVLELQRPGRNASGMVPGWRRELDALRAELTRLRERKAGLRALALGFEREREEAYADALRTYQNLDGRLQRLQQSIDGNARSLDDIQARLREPEPPPPPAPPIESARPGQAGTSRNIDLSGVWLRNGERWLISQRPDATVTLRNPHPGGDQRYDEYHGTLTGRTIVATHRVTADSELSSSLPPRVRAEVAGRGETWTLRLQVNPDGERLEGTHHAFNTSFNARTFAIVRVTPVERPAVFFRRHEPVPQATTPAPSAGPKPPAVDVPPDPRLAELWRQAAHAKDAALRAYETWQRLAQAAEDKSRRVVRPAWQRLLETNHAYQRLQAEVDASRREVNGIGGWLRRLEQQIETLAGLEADVARRMERYPPGPDGFPDEYYPLSNERGRIRGRRIDLQHERENFLRPSREAEERYLFALVVFNEARRDVGPAANAADDAEEAYARAWRQAVQARDAARAAAPR